MREISRNVYLLILVCSLNDAVVSGVFFETAENSTEVTWIGFMNEPLIMKCQFGPAQEKGDWIVRPPHSRGSVNKITGNMEIPKLELSDSGKYKCEPSNGGVYEHTVLVAMVPSQSASRKVIEYVSRDEHCDPVKAEEEVNKVKEFVCGQVEAQEQGKCTVEVIGTCSSDRLSTPSGLKGRLNISLLIESPQPLNLTETADTYCQQVCLPIGHDSQPTVCPLNKQCIREKLYGKNEQILKLIFDRLKGNEQLEAWQMAAQGMMGSSYNQFKREIDYPTDVAAWCPADGFYFYDNTLCLPCEPNQRQLPSRHQRWTPKVCHICNGTDEHPHYGSTTCPLSTNMDAGITFQDVRDFFSGNITLRELYLKSPSTIYASVGSGMAVMVIILFFCCYLKRNPHPSAVEQLMASSSMKSVTSTASHKQSLLKNNNNNNSNSNRRTYHTNVKGYETIYSSDSEITLFSAKMSPI